MVEFERTTNLRRKLKFEVEPTTWSHHRGGWANAFNTLSDLYAHDGVLCISAIEESIIFDGKTIDEPWIGFVHHVPRNNFPHYPDLERLLANEHFRESLKNCHGLFTLSSVVKRYLQENLKPIHPNISVVRILYPITPFPDEKKFNWKKFDETEQKRVLFIGMCLRNFQPFFDLQVPHGFQKYLLKAPMIDFDDLFDCDKQPVSLKMNDTVSIMERVDDERYDDLLSSSVVFLNMYDAPAITTVIECLGRNTPILVNRLPGVEEYLGKDYPLLYNTLEEAEKMLQSRSQLEEATTYLQSHPLLPQLTNQAFLEAFTCSSIYRSLPLPPSQQQDLKQTTFSRFDLTVVVCSYKRVYNLKHLLDCFKKQDYQGTFEVFIWNNNSETQQEVANVAAPYMDELNIRLIQSSQNYYCIIRLAVANLMQSDLLLICDDDVVPQPNYISTFISKYEKYGPRVALSCRGHVFHDHLLDEEDPHQFWKSYCNENLKLCREELPDREVGGCMHSVSLSTTP
jgi:hypothetical protein